MNDGQWGTVCDDEWDLRDAEVVCRVIGCGKAQMAKTSAFFGPGQGDIWLDDVGCFGNETSLMHCRHPTLGENNCGHGEDAGVVCSGIISDRLFIFLYKYIIYLFHIVFPCIHVFVAHNASDEYFAGYVITVGHIVDRLNTNEQNRHSRTRDITFLIARNLLLFKEKPASYISHDAT